MLLFIFLFATQSQDLFNNSTIRGVVSGDSKNVASAVEIITSNGMTPYDFGIKLMQRGEVDEAIFWFETLGRTYDNPKYLFGRAWVRYKSGNYSGALEDALYLSEKDISIKLQARTSYLLGNLGLKVNDYSLARKYLQICTDLYQKINHRTGIYSVYLLLAAVEVSDKNPSNAETYLQKALSIHKELKKPRDLGFYYDVKSEIAFLAGDYKACFSFCQKAKEEYLSSGQTMAADSAEVKIAMLYFMMGKPQDAYNIAANIASKYHDQQEGKVYAYNNALLARLASCGQDSKQYNMRKDHVINWAKSSVGDGNLLEVFEILENHPCP
ncbi:MAG: hypothetical protein QNK37_06920 [Acidobacteriota bacterium]|nr:hypothetical protein [Acidobacteriota bacterium]